jgi:hypothetical protein
VDRLRTEFREEEEKNENGRDESDKASGESTAVEILVYFWIRV